MVYKTSTLNDTPKRNEIIERNQRLCKEKNNAENADSHLKIFYTYFIAKEETMTNFNKSLSRWSPSRNFRIASQLSYN